MKKHVYFFGAGRTEGKGSMRAELGGKGANLAEMALIGIPVPPGFTIDTDSCNEFNNCGQKLPEDIKEEVKDHLAKVEKTLAKKFGDPDNPLLFSVRSGARKSMPGMMDTVLNLGLNDRTLKGLIAKTDNSRFAMDTYRRFIQMYSNVVMGMDGRILEGILENLKEQRHIDKDIQLSTDDLALLCERFKDKIKVHLGVVFPEDPWEQLWNSIGAVFKSWNTPRAIEYRKMERIPNEWGTAVNCQSMVFGNMGDDSATGVAFTRNPSTGDRVFYGEYLINAQGEDVVAGIRTPQPLKASMKNSLNDVALEEAMPEVFGELEGIANKLENHFRDMQDLEFTIEKNKLWLLQTRSGKRTAKAEVKIAIDMLKEGMIDEKTLLGRVGADKFEQLLHPMIDPKISIKPIGKGLPASPGAAVGMVVFNADDASTWAGEGKRVVLVRLETSPDDIHGMRVAEGILTARGGMTSHAAVVARGMGKCCVAGCSDLVVNEHEGYLSVGGVTIRKGEWLSLDGSKGVIYPGQAALIPPETGGDAKEVLAIADKYRKLGVRANADTPEDAAVARKNGATGIGLCRTEHMFFDEERITAVQEMILASNKDERKKALAKLLPFQTEDFKGIFAAMEGYPVTIRLLDPPLHEFLPQTEKDVANVARTLGVSKEAIKAKVEALHEINPMLGHRGCRLGITHPEIYEMQVSAIIEAACYTVKKGIKVLPEIMIPLTSEVKELAILVEMTRMVSDGLIAKHKISLQYLVGTMIELPRAALTADKIAEISDFFSYGTNDLTQTVFGLSRDDAGKFLPVYVDKGIYPHDPFVALDTVGVGELIKIGNTKARAAKSTLKIGICGEHGGNPHSIEFFNANGFNYVSCSPLRVPIARLAAAQSAIAN